MLLFVLTMTVVSCMFAVVKVQNMEALLSSLLIPPLMPLIVYLALYRE